MNCGRSWDFDMYTLKTTEGFDKQFKKLDRSVQIMIKRWIDKHLSGDKDPRAQGKALSATLKGWWRYRIGDYRLLAEIIDDELVIVAVEISHRSRVYKGR